MREEYTDNQTGHPDGEGAKEISSRRQGGLAGTKVSEGGSTPGDGSDSTVRRSAARERAESMRRNRLGEGAATRTERPAYGRVSSNNNREIPDRRTVDKNVSFFEERRRRRKRRKKIKRVILWILFAITAFAVGGVVYVMTPSREPVDHRLYFDLPDGVSYGLIINQERVGSFPVKRAGYWYLDFETVHTYISKKMYYDGESILYTNPTRTFFARPGEKQYTDDEGFSYQVEYEPCYLENGRLYLALEYLKQVDFSYYLADTDRQYVWVWNRWSELPVSQAKSKISVRYGSGIKKPVVDAAEAGETLIILERGTDWVMVQTPRGLIGCVQAAVLQEEKSLTAKTPDGRPRPEYTTKQLDETVCMAWHQVFTESGEKQLDEYLKSADGLNVITPTWFTISNNEGDIQSLADPEYVKKAHKAGLQVWGMVENINIEVDEAQVLGVTAHRKNLIEKVMEEADRVGLDGINIDLEAVGADNGEHLLQFIREMSAACRKKGLVLSVDNYSPMPHTAFYDRAQQAEMVDYVIVMAYDEHYAGGETAGSTSSIGWVRQSAERTLQEVPKEKLLIGLPFYTRLWKETPQEYAEEGARLVTNDNSRFGTYALTSEGIGMEACDKIVKERKLSLSWQETEGQYYVEYEEDHSLYRLWIEDETSMGLKLAEAFSYEPAGVAFFKIGLETEDVWPEIDGYLK